MSYKTLFAVAAVAAGAAFANTNEPSKEPSKEAAVEMEKCEKNMFESHTVVTFFSSYVWRGQIICNTPVWQPSQMFAMNLGEDGEYGAIQLPIWASFYLTDTKKPSQLAGCHIFDTAPAYVYSYGDFDFDVGHIWYFFPNKHKYVRDTDEFFLGVRYRNPIITPYVKVWWDYSDKGRNEKDMFFFDFDFTHTFGLTDELSLTLGSGFGVGSSAYMRSYTGGEVDGADFNYFHSDVMLAYKLTDWLTLGASLSYFYNLSHEVRHSSYDLRDDYHQYLRGGISVAADF